MNIKEIFPTIKENENLEGYSNFGLFGRTKYFLSVKSDTELKQAIVKAHEAGIDFLIMAGGSNMVFPEILNKLLIKIETEEKPKISGDLVSCFAGTSLSLLINETLEAGLSGLEQLSGIPGTVGGAIFGNAGAYGKEISTHLLSVKVFDGEKEIELKKCDCDFAYRSSRFKSSGDLVILSASFRLEKDEPEKLKQISKDIIKKRAEKYPPGLKCPGSFYKNILVADLSQETLELIPEDKKMFGKIPAGYLLEAVGARGLFEGDISVATYHGNLIFNRGAGHQKDVITLSKKLKKMVRDKFGVEIEEEVRMVEGG